LIFLQIKPETFSYFISISRECNGMHLRVFQQPEFDTAAWDSERLIHAVMRNSPKTFAQVRHAVVQHSHMAANLQFSLRQNFII
jgi:hypothetical protein